jgi:hypothetical protein
MKNLHVISNCAALLNSLNNDTSGSTKLNVSKANIARYLGVPKDKLDSMLGTTTD